MRVDHLVGVASGGLGTDPLTLMVGAIGGSGDDTLLGDDGPNLLVARVGGNDKLYGRGGRDTVSPRIAAGSSSPSAST